MLGDVGRLVSERGDDHDHLRQVAHRHVEQPRRDLAHVEAKLLCHVAHALRLRHEREQREEEEQRAVRVGRHWRRREL